MTTPRVLPDSNVLHSRTTRDWILLIALHPSELFHVYYSEDIIATIRRRSPAFDGGAMTRIHDRLIGSMHDRVSAYPMVPHPDINDPKDQHVHSAAIAAGIDYLVTGDSDFTGLPASTIDDLPYEIHTPDSFLIAVDDHHPQVVRAVTLQQHEYWTGRGCRNIATVLLQSSCPLFADRVRAPTRRAFAIAATNAAAPDGIRCWVRRRATDRNVSDCCGYRDLPTPFRLLDVLRR